MAFFSGTPAYLDSPDSIDCYCSKLKTVLQHFEIAYFSLQHVLKYSLQKSGAFLTAVALDSCCQALHSRICILQKRTSTFFIELMVYCQQSFEFIDLVGALMIMTFLIKANGGINIMATARKTS